MAANTRCKIYLNFTCNNQRHHLSVCVEIMLCLFWIHCNRSISSHISCCMEKCLLKRLTHHAAVKTKKLVSQVRITCNYFICRHLSFDMRLINHLLMLVPFFSLCLYKQYKIHFSLMILNYPLELTVFQQI